jgi:ATP-dependent Clp protease ATP-binding subunit ClpC
MYERFTDRARKAMQLANQEAQRFNHEYIGTEHILLGLIKEGGGVAANVLKNLDVDLRTIRLEIEKIVQAGPDKVTMGRLPQTPRAKKVIEFAIEEARNFNHNWVGTEHLLLGVLREEEGVAAQVLMNLGLKLEDVREEVLNLLGDTVNSGEGSSFSGKRSRTLTPALDSFGRDLTELARRGQLPPIVGRKNEQERLLVVLQCRTQNFPLLVGEPGVGKTALVEGLAQWCQGPDGPLAWRDHRIVALNLARMAVHAKSWVRHRQKVARVIQESAQVKKLILFLEDCHALAGLGRTLRNASAAREFKAIFAAGDIPCIGATTQAKYVSVIADDGLLGRLFRPIVVRPTSKEETLAILRSQRSIYEAHHRVQIRDDALDAAVDLSDNYLINRCLPGKAIQLVDEACALVRFQNALALPDLKAIETRIEEIQRDKDKAVASADFLTAASLRDQGEELQMQRDRLLHDRDALAQQITNTVSKETIAAVIRMATGMWPPQG